MEYKTGQLANYVSKETSARVQVTKNVYLPFPGSINLALWNDWAESLEAMNWIPAHTIYNLIHMEYKTGHLVKYVNWTYYIISKPNVRFSKMRELNHWRNWTRSQLNSVYHLIHQLSLYFEKKRMKSGQLARSVNMTELRVLRTKQQAKRWAFGTFKWFEPNFQVSWAERPGDSNLWKEPK